VNAELEFDPQDIVTFGGHVIVGFTSSSKVMICTQVSTFPHASVAVQVLIRSCLQPCAVYASVCLMVMLLVQLSVACAMPVFDGVVLALQDKVRLSGQVIIGAILSITVMVCKHSFWIPHGSIARHLLVTVPLQLEPVNVLSKLEMVTLPQLSVPKFAVNQSAGRQAIVKLAGQIIEGAAWSLK
jgi:hypothetical protein